MIFVSSSSIYFAGDVMMMLRLCDVVWRVNSFWIPFSVKSVFSRIAGTVATVCTRQSLWIRFEATQLETRKCIRPIAPSANAYRVPSIERNVSLSNGYTNSDQHSFYYYVWNLKSICSMNMKRSRRFHRQIRPMVISIYFMLWIARRLIDRKLSDAVQFHRRHYHCTQLVSRFQPVLQSNYIIGRNSW